MVHSERALLTAINAHPSFFLLVALRQANIVALGHQKSSQVVAEAPEAPEKAVPASFAARAHAERPVTAVIAIP